ncbi:hypothetical protein JCM6882_001908 [Rhodosporidiobolus microsporus]
MSSSSSASPPTSTTLDSSSSALTYSGAWRTYTGSSGLYDATGWSDGTFASCGGNAVDERVPASSSGVRCDVRVPFEGTSIALYGDTNPGHGVFSCRLERENDSTGESEPEGTWGWFYGGSQSNQRPYQLNATLCAVSGIPSGKHTLVLGVEPDQVEDGIAFDYATYSNNSEDEGTSYTWSSLFNHAVPPSTLRNTTATPSLPSSTSSPSSSSTSSPSSTGKGANVVGLAVGVSIGGACALAALVIAFFLWRKRRERRRRNAAAYPVQQHERDDSASAFGDGDSVWFPGRTEVGAASAAAVAGGAAAAAAKAGEGGGGEKGGYSPASGGSRGSSGYGGVRGEGQWQGFPQESPPSTWRNSKSGGGSGGVYSPVPTSGYDPFAYPTHSASDQSYSSPSFPPSAPYSHPHSHGQTSTASFASTLVTPAPLPPTAPHRASLTSAPVAAPAAKPFVEELPFDAKLADPDEFRERV